MMESPQCALYDALWCFDTEYDNVALGKILGRIALRCFDTEYANVLPDKILGRIASWCFDTEYANVAPNMMDSHHCTLYVSEQIFPCLYFLVDTVFYFLNCFIRVNASLIQI